MRNKLEAFASGYIVPTIHKWGPDGAFDLTAPDI